MNLVLGVDIGITSVGWGIIDNDTHKIIDAGVRLFEESDASMNQKRRSFRSSRRLKRRKAFRIYRMEKFLESIGVKTINYKVNQYNPYECRVKGLTSKLNNEELTCAILHITKLRGSSFETVEDDDNGETKKILNENSSKVNSGKYICELQLEKLNNTGKIRGHDNIFKTKDYLNELEKILSNQALKENEKEAIIEIVKSKRLFSEGPGSKNSPTIYGRYLELNQEEPIDLIQKMRGKCTFFKDELRAPSNSYKYSLFNLLNDLNNLNIDGRKISNLEKETIINNYIEKKGTITLNEISKITNVSKDLINGYRIDKSEKPLFTEFKGYNLIRRVIEKPEYTEFHDLLQNKDFIDNVIEILTRTKILEDRKKEIISLKYFENEFLAHDIASISGISGYGYLSDKALDLFINEMLYSTENQMQISTRLNLNEEYNKYLINKRNIPFDSENITNPVAIRAEREAIKVINEIRKKYGELESIVVELAREKNSKEETKNILNGQKNNELINKSLEEYSKNIKLTQQQKLKLRLAIEQDWVCPYTFEKINLDSLLQNENAYEVDHILPLSLSFDDSFNNKVLVTHDANQDKGQRTPFEYFNLGKSNISFSQFTQWVLNNNGYKNKDRKKKIQNLLSKEDLTDNAVSEKFVNRNLVDTRYASRYFLNQLQKYYKANNIGTKVFTIRGSITDQFRKKGHIEKNRDYYKHHAVDALIMASVRNNKILIRKLDKAAYKEKKGIVSNDFVSIDENTGEVVSSSYIFDEETMHKIGNIKVFDRQNNFKFSYKVDRKPNRSISDQTIYSTRTIDKQEMVVKKYNLYDNGEAIKKLILEDKEKLLCYKYDKKTFDILEMIVNQYVTEKNPFAIYKNEFGLIRKYSKKGNGPIIEDLKYLDGKLGNHIDISKKYNSKNKRVVLLQVSPYRMDLYNDNGIYKFITVRYSNVSEKSGSYFISEEWYKSELAKKKISDKAKFIYSFYKNDYIGISKNGVMQIYRFVTVNNDINNVIELKLISEKTQKRITPTISKLTENITKYYSDILGTIYEVSNETLKFKL